MMYGSLRKSSRNKSQNEIPCTKGSSSEDITNSLLKQNTWSRNPGLTMKFSILLI